MRQDIDIFLIQPVDGMSRITVTNMTESVVAENVLRVMADGEIFIFPLPNLAYSYSYLTEE